MEQQQKQPPLPRLRRLLRRGRRRGRRQLRALTPRPYNYKADCAGAQKLFYAGFVLSSIASVAFLISFVFNSGGSSNQNLDSNIDGNATQPQQSLSVSRRRELGLFETLALLCSAFGLCLIAGVFLCGLYVTRRRKDLDEERLLAGGGGCWDDDEDDDGATQTTETPGGDLSSYSISSAPGASVPAQADGMCADCGCRRSPGHHEDEEADLDADDDEEFDEEDDDEDDAANGGGGVGQSRRPVAAAERLVRRALNCGVPRRLRRCTCGQISTVSRLSDQRTEAGEPCSLAMPTGVEGLDQSDQSIAFF